MTSRQMKREAKRRLRRKIILICFVTILLLCLFVGYLVTMDMHNVSQDFMMQRYDSSIHDNNSKLQFAKSYSVQKEKQSQNDRDEDKKGSSSGNKTGSTDNGKSGILFGDYPGELFAISMTGEGSGGAQGLMGDRGRAYGLMQLDYRYALIDFVKWVVGKYPDLWSELAPFAGIPKASAELVGNQGILSAFESARSKDNKQFMSTQCEYFYNNYFKSQYDALKNAGIDLEERNVAVSSALLSISVNTGAQGSKYVSFLNNNMTDEEMIRMLYAKRRDGTLKSSGCTDARWQSANEEQQAIDMLNGAWTIDSNYERADAWSSGWHWDKLEATYFK